MRGYLDSLFKAILAEFLTPEGLFNSFFLAALIYLYQTTQGDFIREIKELKSYGYPDLTSDVLIRGLETERNLTFVLIIIIVLAGLGSLFIVHRSFQKNGSALIERFFPRQEDDRNHFI